MRVTVAQLRCSREQIPDYDLVVKDLTSQCLQAAIQDSPRNSQAQLHLFTGRMFVTRFSISEIAHVSDRLLDSWKAIVHRSIPGSKRDLIVHQSSDRCWTFEFKTPRTDNKRAEICRLLAYLLVCCLLMACVLSSAMHYRKWVLGLFE